MRYLEELEKAFHEVVCTDESEMPYEAMMERVLLMLYEAKQNNKKLCFVGNGGSAAIAIHMTNDFLKNGGIRTHSMHDAATLTCLGNDFDFAQIFSRQLEMIANEGDILVAISSSGKSPNILKAVEKAKEKGCRVITLSGFKEDNPLRQTGDINIYVPCMWYGIVESLHNLILQQVVDEILIRDDKSMK